MRRKILGILQIAAAHTLVYWLFRFKTDLTIDRQEIKEIQPPFIVIGNHTSFFDPALVQFAVNCYPVYFLTSNFYFRYPLIGKI